MLTAKCQRIFFCPFKAEATLLSSQDKNCRRINAQTWSSEQTMIFTWNGAGFLPMQKFLDCFPKEKLEEKELFLFGSAGAVNDTHQPGQIFTINSIKCHDQQVEIDSVEGLTPILALTKDTPVLSTILRQNIFEKHGDCLIDQESFHFVEYFRKLGIKTRIIRFVSDTPSFPFRLPFAKSMTSHFSQEWKKRFENGNESS